MTVIDSRDHTTSATNAPRRVSVVSQTCTGCRLRRGAKASTTMPTSFVIDAKGIIKHVNEGYVAGDEKKYKKQIDALL